MSAPGSNILPVSIVLPASIVILDTEPLGLVSNPKAPPDNDACRWMLSSCRAGA